MTDETTITGNEEVPIGGLPVGTHVIWNTESGDEVYRIVFASLNKTPNVNCILVTDPDSGMVDEWPASRCVEVLDD